jgi:hypothetical protein
MRPHMMHYHRIGDQTIKKTMRPKRPSWSHPTEGCAVRVARCL